MPVPKEMTRRDLIMISLYTYAPISEVPSNINEFFWEGINQISNDRTSGICARPDTNYPYRPNSVSYIRPVIPF